MSGHDHGHHGHGGALSADGRALFALVGSPNCGKTTMFNALTGLRAKTGNYPGVTVSRYLGLTEVDGRDVVIEDLPGTYSLDPISPDEHVVIDALDGGFGDTPDGLLVLLDATTLRRGLALLAQVLLVDRPVCVVLTFTDELARRQGSIDTAALSRALGLRVIESAQGSRDAVARVREAMSEVDTWPRPPIPPPTDTAEIRAWIESVLAAASYSVPATDARTQRIDRVLLHPLWGGLIFFAVMFLFFQVIFTVAAPLQGLVEAGFAWLGGAVADHVHNRWISGLLGDALIGGVGGVVVFLPQIALLFLIVSVLEGIGYMSRAAFIMDRIMSRSGLEGRAFVVLLSSVACAVPGIMATRTLPSANDRLATMLSAPLMTCSARLPVYVLLIGLLVDSTTTIGPFGAQGIVMFGFYLLGACSAMATAWVAKKLQDRNEPILPFYMEMPTYRLPSLRSVLLSVWDSCQHFLRKVGTIIVGATLVLWLLLNLPVQSSSDLQAAGVDPTDHGAVASYVIEHSYAAALGRAVEPVFEPLGFDWRINIGVLASLSAREVYVATMGQIAAATNPDDPAAELRSMRVESGPRAGELLFSAPTVAALLVFFAYALQCMSTIGVMRRESGSWKWPAIAFGYMFALAWTLGLLAHTLVAAFT